MRKYVSQINNEKTENVKGWKYQSTPEQQDTLNRHAASEFLFVFYLIAIEIIVTCELLRLLQEKLLETGHCLLGDVFCRSYIDNENTA